MDEDFLQQEFEADIDLTPLIDVIFMLLLFFILASTFSQPALRVALPSATTATPVENEPPRMVFSIDADGALHHLGAVLTPADLPRLLETAPERPVDLRVDRTAPFQAFVTVLDRLRACGRNDVFITAQPE
ncbi:MAG: biopolymer transporter ExbD [Verrucomicrobia bacterium]|nr:biopolymer transporter ExbD [Verrucomicrobiota bacterium]MBU1910752.1 biopolymer transporter ExbD [Verrucomicrobiota bacterium]